MSMALALARASELNDNQPDKVVKVEAIKEFPITNELARKINVASGEDVGFDVDADEAWDWHNHEHSLMLGNPNVY